MKFDFRSESFKRKFGSNLLACNLIIGCSVKNRKNFPEKAFEQRNKETLAFEQLGLADLGNQRVIIQMVN